MSVTDIKFKIKEVFWIEKLRSFLDAHQCSALEPMGAHSTTPSPIPTPQTPNYFSKTAMPKFRLDKPLGGYQ